MSSPGQPEMVFCHECEDEWFRNEHGLTCPRCHSDFVEVIEANNNLHDFLHHSQDDDNDDDDAHNPWSSVGARAGGRVMPGTFGSYDAPGFPFSSFPSQPANSAGQPDFRFSEHRSPDGSTVVTSFTYRGGGAAPPDTHAQVMNNFSGMMQGILGNIQASRVAGHPAFGSPPGSPPPLRPRNANGPQPPQQTVDPLPSILSQFFPLQAGQRAPPSPGMHDDMHNPLMNFMRMMMSGPFSMHGGHGDAAYSQEEFDRIMSQLLEQAQQGGGVPPASEQEISRLRRTSVTQEWLDSQEHKECTICLNEATVDEEINELWCGHWYHPECIKIWLDSHDQCPLCRKPLQQSREEYEAKQSKNPTRRHSSRTHSQSHWRGPRDDGSSGGSNTQDGAGASSLRERISNLFGRNNGRS